MSGPPDPSGGTESGSSAESENQGPGRAAWWRVSVGRTGQTRAPSKGHEWSNGQAVGTAGNPGFMEAKEERVALSEVSSLSNDKRGEGH